MNDESVEFPPDEVVQPADAEQQLRRDRDRLQLLLEVGNNVASHLDLRDLFKAISQSVRQVIDHGAAALTLYDAEHDALRVHALESDQGLHSLWEGELLPLKNSPTGETFASRQPLLVGRYDSTNYSSPSAQRGYALGIRSGIIVPLVFRDRALGTLSAVSLQEDAFDENDLELLTQIANQVAIAVENALNYEQARAAQLRYEQERDRLQLLLDINNRIASHLDLQELFKAISQCLRQVIHHGAAALAIFDPEGQVLRVHTLDLERRPSTVEIGEIIPFDDNPAGQAFILRKPILTRELDAATYKAPIAKRAYQDGVRSGCDVPLLAHGRALGTLTVVSPQPNTFDESHADLLMQIGKQVALAVENALAYREIEALKDKLASEKLYLEEEIQTGYNFEEIIGQSAALRRILKQVETAAPTDSTVLIQGETGTGKELVARAIHNLSGRKERTMVKVNCAAIPTGLLESELFGHEKGAFTGAIAQRIGRFELAHRGTLFLDEVGDIPLELQPKMLRVLQEQEFERLGSTRTIRVDARLVAATNCELQQLVAEKKYRSDLFYRLNVFPIHIPPLRERPEDVMLLARFFAQKFARKMKKRIESISARAQDALLNYDWPGNVRELENFIERAVILTHGTDLEINTRDLKRTKDASVTIPASSVPPTTGGQTVTTMESAERDHILRALQESNWTIGGETGAAARLGMKRTTLQSRMRKLGINRPQ